ncbi:CaiB/BaiF CoA transferase family protein [Pseudochryseolinea flava]|uniref:CoA transferase n=1 Tax=Pseudochryseolinea flava TaxID=2059302 RepID=A0A364XU84_9BACT|nr:CaiB/BaiF CoA-transferase family protein [Pseudochryseolinea flava]RAV97897.1 CoA transferase [Pseudochryseolinea flava]
MEIFKDFKVLELASVLAGPSVGQFFAELGAEVIKVENPTTYGDVTRSWKVSGEKTDDRSAYFCSVNWGKKSIALDLHVEEDLVIVKKLALRADLIIASYKPGDAEKLGVDYQTLSQSNPGVIYAQVSGYGWDNARVGYDAVIQAEAGFMSMNGEVDGASLKMPVALMDLLAGHQLKEGILLALLEKSRTGRGKHVAVSLIESAVASLANQATNWLVAGKLPKKQGSSHPNIAPYGDVFKSKDEREILLAVGSDRQFADLCEIIGVREIAFEERFKKNASRVENRLELNTILQSGIGSLGADELMVKINTKKIPAGVIQTMDKVFEMHEVLGMIMTHGQLKGVRTMVVDGIDRNTSLLPPPKLDEHSDEVRALI